MSRIIVPVEAHTNVADVRILLVSYELLAFRAQPADRLENADAAVGVRSAVEKDGAVSERGETLTSKRQPGVDQFATVEESGKDWRRLEAVLGDPASELFYGITAQSASRRLPVSAIHFAPVD